MNLFDLAVKRMNRTHMIKTEIEDLVLDTLRRTALSGSRRTVGLDEPLGELGLGLDSLALIEFATAIEKRFQVQLPDEMWMDRGQLSLRRLSDWIHQSISSSRLAGAEALRASPAQPDTAEKNTPLEAAPASRQDAGLFRTLGRRLISALGSFYRHEKWYVLECRLKDKSLPASRPALSASRHGARNRSSVWIDFLHRDTAAPIPG